jgi:hypothetical protein
VKVTSQHGKMARTRTQGQHVKGLHSSGMARSDLGKGLSMHVTERPNRAKTLLLSPPRDVSTYVSCAPQKGRNGVGGGGGSEGWRFWGRSPTTHTTKPSTNGPGVHDVRECEEHRLPPYGKGALMGRQAQARHAPGLDWTTPRPHHSPCGETAPPRTARRSDAGGAYTA